MRDGHPRRDLSEGAAAGAVPLSREVLEGVRAREPEALAALFEAHFDRLYNLASRLLGDRTAAQDIIQDVFLRVHRSAHTLDAERDPGPWLTAITYNECRQRWRRAGRRGENRSRSLDDSPELHELMAGAALDPEQEALARERRARLEAAIVSLPEPMRTVVVMHDQLGMSHESIAEAMGTTHAGVRKRYSRALARLRELLQDLLS